MLYVYRASYFTVILFCVRRVRIVSGPPAGDENPSSRTTVVKMISPASRDARPVSYSYPPFARRNAAIYRTNSTEHWKVIRRPWRERRFVVIATNCYLSRCFYLLFDDILDEINEVSLNVNDRVLQTFRRRIAR